MDTKMKVQILEEMFTLQVTVKLCHFQTTNRNHHADLDAYYSSFSDNMDKLIECMSSEERFDVQRLNLEINYFNSIEVLGLIESFLTDLSKQFGEIRWFDTIIQDMIIQTRRTLYLLKAH